MIVKKSDSDKSRGDPRPCEKKRSMGYTPTWPAGEGRRGDFLLEPGKDKENVCERAKEKKASLSQGRGGGLGGGGGGGKEGTKRKVILVLSRRILSF